jgi:hypothetical protein
MSFETCRAGNIDINQHTVSILQETIVSRGACHGYRHADDQSCGSNIQMDFSMLHLMKCLQMDLVN